MEQFADLLVVILIAASIISTLSGEIGLTIVILVVLIMNAILGTAQNVKAQKSLAALKAMSSPNAHVIRNGNQIEIPASDVVVGDILLIEAGNVSAADGQFTDLWILILLLQEIILSLLQLLQPSHLLLLSF